MIPNFWTLFSTLTQSQNGWLCLLVVITCVRGGQCVLIQDNLSLWHNSWHMNCRLSGATYAYLYFTAFFFTISCSPQYCLVEFFVYKEQQCLLRWSFNLFSFSVLGVFSIVCSFKRHKLQIFLKTSFSGFGIDAFLGQGVG